MMSSWMRAQACTSSSAAQTRSASRGPGASSPATVRSDDDVPQRQPAKAKTGRMRLPPRRTKSRISSAASPTATIAAMAGYVGEPASASERSAGTASSEVGVGIVEVTLPGYTTSSVHCAEVTPTAPAPSIVERLAAPHRGPVPFSVEFFPPRDAEAESRLWRAVRIFERLSPAFVSMTYGAGGSTRDRTVRITGELAAQTTLLPVAHLTAVNHSVAELRALVGAYADQGITNILAARRSAGRSARRVGRPSRRGRVRRTTVT